MKLCEYLNRTAEIYALHYIIALADPSNPIKIFGTIEHEKWDTSLQLFSIYTDTDIDIYRKVKIKGAKYAFIFISSNISSKLIAQVIIGIITATNLEIKNQVRITLLSMLW
jgi:hypothetical protein